MYDKTHAEKVVFQAKSVFLRRQKSVATLVARHDRCLAARFARCSQYHHYRLTVQVTVMQIFTPSRFIKVWNAIGIILGRHGARAIC